MVNPVRRAVIDVGTNSIKLLVADVAGREVHPVFEESRQTRLGRGFYETHQLQPAAIAATAQAVAEFAEVARRQQAASLQVIATSAARDARNPQELLSAIKAASGLSVEIISGEQEADWGFQGVTSDPQYAQCALLLVDVGGGSSEFILGQGGQKQFAGSFALGTVRLLESLPHGDPPKPAELAACRQRLRQFLEREVQPGLGPVLEAGNASPGGMKLVGVGGTASILGCMEAMLDHFDRARLETTRLSYARLREHVERLWSLGLEARKQIIGLPRNRADVILTGAAIYESILDQFGFAELHISTRGLRFAAVINDRQVSARPEKSS